MSLLEKNLNRNPEKVYKKLILADSRGEYSDVEGAIYFYVNDDEYVYAMDEDLSIWEIKDWGDGIYYLEIDWDEAPEGIFEAAGANPDFVVWLFDEKPRRTGRPAVAPDYEVRAKDVDEAARKLFDEIQNDDLPDRFWVFFYREGDASQLYEVEWRQGGSYRLHEV